MKFLLLGIIRLYWRIVPAHKRPVCIFCESCSNYVFRITKEQGTRKGIAALFERFQQCRPGYKIQFNHDTQNFELQLKSGDILEENKISGLLIAPLRNCISWP